MLSPNIVYVILRVFITGKGTIVTIDKQLCQLNFDEKKLGNLVRPPNKLFVEP